MAAPPIPSFYLYGEAPRAVDGRFVHLEALDDRSRPSEWTIRAHSHAALHQLFLIRTGAGVMRVDGAALAFRAPCLLLAPAGTVHGFAYEAESAGSVLTLAVAVLDELAARTPALAAVFARAAALDAAGALPELEADLAALGRELGWAAPGHALAVEARVASVLVAALRLRHAAAEPAVAVGRRAELVARFRAAAARHVRTPRPLAAYAAELCVPASRLRTACRAVTGAGPLALLQERRMLEARRLLAYSTLGVAEIAYSLGLDDAAYFTRAFTRAEGVSPRAYRERLRAQADGGGGSMAGAAPITPAAPER